MNKTLMNRIADMIEKYPENYDQGTWSNDEKICPITAKGKPKCGTAHCIAGWAVALSVKKPVIDDEAWNKGRKFLGLNGAEADHLFNSGWEPNGDLTVPEQLRAYAAVGRVWDA